MLGTLGLSPDDQRVYEVLLGREHGSTASIASAVGLTPTEVGEALHRLVGLGFAVAGPRELPRAVAPGTAIHGLIELREAEAAARAAELKRVRMTADELVARFLVSAADAVASPHIELVVGHAEIGRRVAELTNSATKEVLVLDRPPYAQPGGQQGAPDSDAAIDRGVDLRVVFDADGLDVDGRMESITRLAARGLQARVTSQVPTKLVIVDGTIAVLPPSDHADPRAAAVVAREHLLLNALVPLFEATWARAAPLGTAASAPLTDDERILLGMLMSGQKDEAMARQLGVHVRTARRRISGLLRRLDATTRFQAGVQAARLGWLESDRDPQP